MNATIQKAIKSAIKARAKRNGDNDRYGMCAPTRWNAPIPEWHFVLRDAGIEILTRPARYEAVDRDGNVICTAPRRYSSRKISLCYPELQPNTFTFC